MALPHSGRLAIFESTRWVCGINVSTFKRRRARRHQIASSKKSEADIEVACLTRGLGDLNKKPRSACTGFAPSAPHTSGYIGGGGGGHLRALLAPRHCSLLGGGCIAARSLLRLRLRFEARGSGLRFRVVASGFWVYFGVGLGLEVKAFGVEG